MDNSYSFTVHGYIPRSPNASARKHWGRKMDERNFWEAVIALSLWSTVDGTFFSRVKKSVDIKICKPGIVKLRDKDNLWASVKHVVDAMVNLELLVDDEPKWCDLNVTEENGHKGYACEITIGWDD